MCKKCSVACCIEELKFKSTAKLLLAVDFIHDGKSPDNVGKCVQTTLPPKACEGWWLSIFNQIYVTELFLRLQGPILTAESLSWKTPLELCMFI